MNVRNEASVLLACSISAGKSGRLKMISVSLSHPGFVRQNNEDCIRTDDKLGIYLLADGMGGHNAGEVASALAVDTAFVALSSKIENTAVDCLAELMENAMYAAHLEISTKARTGLSFMGMGTTLVIVVVRESTAYVAHAGDSRCYHFSSSRHLKQITKDHTMGDQLLAHGIPREQIQEKQFHNLTQAVGYGERPIPDFNTVELNQGDILLLCSDGLTDMLADNEIEAILANGDARLDSLPERLVDTANAKGGRDNISVVLIRCSE